jgi:predicted  nucleic acid-binding Zn-ribbon protein
MCFAKPGPRCYGHASEKLKNTQSKLSAAEAAVKEIEQKAKAIAVKNPKNYKDRADYRTLQQRYGAGQTKVSRLKHQLKEDTVETDATTGGIEELQKRVDALNPALDTEVKEFEELTRRLDAAKISYKNKLFKYDCEKGTVHGRNPSPYGSDKGLLMLQAKKKSLVEKAAAATGEKKEKYQEQVASVNEQILHAKETRSYAQSNITDKPSANLAANKVKLQEAYSELAKANEGYLKGQDEYTNGPVQRMRDFIEEQKKAGHSARSKWSAADKRTYKNMEAEAEAMWNERVKPFMYRVRQFEGISKKLEDQISLGSITPKQRALNKQRSWYGPRFGG